MPSDLRAVPTDMRLDVYLCGSGLAPSRQKAQQMIASEQVLVDGKTVTKASFAIDEDAPPAVTLQGRVLPYVSRGGLKLEAALDAFSLDVTDLRAVDIGASTGGFTDCLLQRGAREVVAVDCGTDQLHARLRADARVRVHEQCNARTLTAEQIGGHCDLAVMDVSFISQTQLYTAVRAVLKPNGYLVSLIKPQFEAGRAALSKKGVVREEKVRQACVARVCDTARACGLCVQGVVPSPIVGGDGNVEYLALFKLEEKSGENK